MPIYRLAFFCIIIFCALLTSNAQTNVGDLIDQVDRDTIIKKVREFSGEDSCTVSGSRVLILNRNSDQENRMADRYLERKFLLHPPSVNQQVDSILLSKLYPNGSHLCNHVKPKEISPGDDILVRRRRDYEGNDLAASYLEQQFLSYGIPVIKDVYDTKGTNIIATQLGKEDPDNVYIICAHYDAVGNYGADDNASGSIAVLEAARILSNYEFENTIIYALWDEEETGLHGARNYANAASSKNMNIAAVMNMDMIGHDGDGDKVFDIDVIDVANSYQIKDDLLSVVDDYNLDLVGSVVDPGTPLSDHSVFWDKGYSAVLLGEAWSKDDVTPGYHTPNNDRINLFNLDYFYNMVKLSTGYIATKGNLIGVVGIESLEHNELTVFPNPASDFITLSIVPTGNYSIVINNLLGDQIVSKNIEGAVIDISELQEGGYILTIFNTDNKVVSRNLFYSK